jgi:L-asparaginase II
VIATRGQGVDAWHSVSVAVVDNTGKLLSHVGEPGLVTMARSSIKPLQALPLVRSGAADHFGLCSEELAIVQASHSGTDEHVRWVQRLLAKAHSSAADLGCGGHIPFFLAHEKRWPQHGEENDPLRHNCSGKHAGFLLLAQHLGVPNVDYLAPESTLQAQVKAAVAEHAGLQPSALHVGVDGCSAPNFGLSLSALGRAFAAFATAAPGEPLARLRAAMLAHPHLVSGHGQFDLELMTASRGSIVCKGGAEAIIALGILPLGLGVVIKVHDGNARAIPPACLAVLEQLGALPSGQAGALSGYVRPVLHNARGIATGELVADLRLV